MATPGPTGVDRNGPFGVVSPASTGQWATDQQGVELSYNGDTRVTDKLPESKVPESEVPELEVPESRHGSPESRA